MTARAVRPRGHRERGQLVTSLSVIFAVVALLVLVYLFIPIGAATTEKGQSQTAADAAALAAAQEMADDWVDGLIGGSFSSLDELWTAVRLTGGSCAQSYRGVADDYAGRNGASVEDYCVDWPAGRVEATVIRNATVGPGESRARARARAELGIDPNSCTLPAGFPPPAPTPTPTPTPTSTASPTPTPTPTPTPAITVQMTCAGGVKLSVLYKDGNFKFTGVSKDALLDLAKPRLSA